MEAPVNQKITAPPEMRPRRKGACRRESDAILSALEAGEQDNDGEDHCCSPDHGGPDEHGLGSRLESVACTVILLQVLFRLLELGLETEVFFDLCLDVGNQLDERELVDRLRVVG